MRKTLLIAIILFILVLTPSTAFAQGMPAPSAVEGMGSWTSSPSSVTSGDHTASEEAEGKEIWEKFQEKEVDCKDLSDEDFGALGEYFMGQMVGEQHEAMNNVMIQMMGEEGEIQMHIVMGKRLSSCDTSAQVPSSGIGFMPMMWMMGGGGSPMMGNWGQNPFVWFGFGSWLVTLTLVVWLIVGVLATIWFWKQLKKK